MADWVDITDAQVDPDAPITSELGYAFRDNVVAMTEGAAGAPRIAQSALLNPTAGNARTITSPSVSVLSGQGGSLLRASCIRPGAVRIVTTVTAIAPSGVRFVNVARTRNGNTTTINSYNTTGTRTDDVPVIIGDVISVGYNSGDQPLEASAQLRLGNDAIGVIVL